MAFLRIVIRDTAQLYIPFAFSALSLTIFGVMVATAGNLTAGWIAVFSTLTFVLIAIFVACLLALRCCLRAEKIAYDDDEDREYGGGGGGGARTASRLVTPRTAAAFMDDPRLRMPGSVMGMSRGRGASEHIEMRGMAAQQQRESEAEQVSDVAG